MKNKVSRAIVIDASIAMAAGETTHPTSMLCREFLEEVLRICHRMVLNPELLGEWQKHASRFGHSWRFRMARQGKIVALVHAANKELWGAFSGSECPESDYRRISKDLHLVDAAMQTDRRVASLDDRVRASLHNCLEQKPEIGDIAWLNPSMETEQAIDWLKKGAPRERTRLLRCYQPSSSIPEKTKG